MCSISLPLRTIAWICIAPGKSVAWVVTDAIYLAFCPRHGFTLTENPARFAENADVEILNLDRLFFFTLGVHTPQTDTYCCSLRNVNCEFGNNKKDTKKATGNLFPYNQYVCKHLIKADWRAVVIMQFLRFLLFCKLRFVKFKSILLLYERISPLQPSVS